MKFLLLRGQAKWIQSKIKVGGIFWVNKKVKCRVYKVTERRAYIGLDHDPTETIDVKLDCLFTQRFYVKKPYTHYLYLNTKTNEKELEAINQ